MKRSDTNMLLLVGLAIAAGAVTLSVILSQQDSSDSAAIQTPMEQSEALNEARGTPSSNSSTANWRGFDTKDLGITFLYPPEWGEITSSQRITDAIRSDEYYDGAYVLPDAWEESRSKCSGANTENAKYGFSACWWRSFGVTIDGARKGIVSVTGNLYIPQPTDGNSFSLVATNLFGQSCTANNKCSTFTNENGVTIQRRHGKWNMGDNPDYFIYAILPSPTDTDTKGYVFSTEDFESDGNAPAIFEAMVNTVAYVNR